MSLETELAAASTREQYIAVLKVTLTELATALCRLAHDEGLPLPYDVTFKDRSRWYSHVAELWINDTMAWTKEPEAKHFSLPISGTLRSADGRKVTMHTLKSPLVRMLFVYRRNLRMRCNTQGLNANGYMNTF